MASFSLQRRSTAALGNTLLCSLIVARYEQSLQPDDVQQGRPALGRFRDNFCASPSIHGADLHLADFDDATHLEITTLLTRPRFTPNPALVILLGAVIVATSCCFEMAFRFEKSPPLSTLLSGLIPELLLVAVIARASIHLYHLQSQIVTTRRFVAALRHLAASQLQSITADRTNLDKLHCIISYSASHDDREVSERIAITAVNSEHTLSIAQRLGLVIEQMDDALHPIHGAVDRGSSQARIETQHQAPAAMKLRTLPNGSLDRNQLIELR